jgi:hypothetical protein
MRMAAGTSSTTGADSTGHRGGRIADRRRRCLTRATTSRWQTGSCPSPGATPWSVCCAPETRRPQPRRVERSGSEFGPNTGGVSASTYLCGPRSTIDWFSGSQRIRLSGRSWPAKKGGGRRSPDGLISPITRSSARPRSYAACTGGNTGGLVSRRIHGWQVCGGWLVIATGALAPSPTAAAYSTSASARHGHETSWVATRPPMQGPRNAVFRRLG